MPVTLYMTGSPGAGVSIAAAAAAIHLAGRGERTLLVSFGTAIGMSALLGREVGAHATQFLPNLSVIASDPSADLADIWGRGWVQLPAQLARLTPDELPLLPGLGPLLGLIRLLDVQTGYDYLVIDAGAHDLLLLALGLPDSMRWMTRLLIGLDRGPGQSRASQSQAMVPSGFLPSGFVQGIQELRLRVESMRSTLTNPATTSACYVLRPDAAALAEARLAVPALQLHGLAVSSIAIGPLGQGADIPEEAAAAWPTRPWVPFPAQTSTGLSGLTGLAPALASCIPDGGAEPPIQERRSDSALTIDLPGLPKGALGLTVSGDELILRTGPYRRHMLLPDVLRGAAGIRATREGELLVVRKRA